MDVSIVINALNKYIFDPPKTKYLSFTQSSCAIRTFNNLCNLAEQYLFQSNSNLCTKQFPSFKVFINNNLNLDLAKVCVNYEEVMEKLGYPEYYFFKKIKKLSNIETYIKIFLETYPSDINVILEDLKSYSNRKVKKAIQAMLTKDNKYTRDTHISMTFRLLTIYFSAKGDVNKLNKTKLGSDATNDLIKLSKTMNTVQR